MINLLNSRSNDLITDAFFANIEIFTYSGSYRYEMKLMFFMLD